jgi:3-oxoacyl-[acyl-carrier-protein] synthase-1
VRRVAIVGMGIVSSIGNTTAEVVTSLRQGRSGIEFIPERKGLGFRSALGGRIKNLPALDAPKRNLRQMGPGSQLAVHAAQQAIADAGIEPPVFQSGRVGVVVGNIGNAQDIYRQCRMFHDKTMKLGGTAMQKAMTDSASANLSVLLGTRGYALTMSAACATGAVTIGFSSQLIRWGLQDLCICGGTQEDGWESVCHFDALQAFSTREDDPTKASRPFDKYRDGLVPSVGAGIVILEELEHAQRRGARIYAEVMGYATNSDGYDMTVPSGEGTVRCMELALEDAGMAPGQVDYLNAHATSTPVGDAVEARAIAQVFGDGTYVSSTKSMTGHELGAAGSNELIYCLLMMQHNFIAPNINIEEIDPQCLGINLVANRSREAPIEVAASNSSGFGGVNTCIILQRYRS